MDHLKDDFEFNVHWKPFLLNPVIPEEGIPAMDYFRLKFGEEAAQRFVSGNSPVTLRGRELVGHCLTPVMLPLGGSTLNLPSKLLKYAFVAVL